MAILESGNPSQPSSNTAPKGLPFAEITTTTTTTKPTLTAIQSAIDDTEDWIPLSNTTGNTMGTSSSPSPTTTVTTMYDDMEVDLDVEEMPKLATSGNQSSNDDKEDHEDTNRSEDSMGIDDVGSIDSSSRSCVSKDDVEADYNDDHDDDDDEGDEHSVTSHSVSSELKRKEELGSPEIVCCRRIFYFVVLISAAFISTVVFIALNDDSMDENGEGGDDATFKNDTAVGVMVVVMFVFIIITFCIYDFLVGQRQSQLVRTANKQEKLMSSMFPKNIHNILLEDESNGRRLQSANRGSALRKARLKTLMKDGGVSISNHGSVRGDIEENTSSAFSLGGSGSVVSGADDGDQPIADLFPECTILFADIAGFTAWSSAREPGHVFKLLETIYSAFDRIAKRKGVYKVETIGDCYVAVCGLPDPRKDHAVAMGRFARAMVEAFNIKMKELEVKLGPDTTNLALRAGLHSGPVVAGVLRTQNSRFQLFGDTMNSASRMESTGVPNKIQVSQDTANLLTEAGKGYWLTPREEKVEAKGKGKLQTYFLFEKRIKSDASCSSSIGSKMDSAEFDTTDKRARTAEWVVELLSSILKEISAYRSTRPVKEEQITSQREFELYSMCTSRNVIDEVAPVIILPEYDGSYGDSTGVILDEKALTELRCYVQTIAELYKDNPFHCFEHASHVTLSCAKLLSRVTAPDIGLDACDQTIHHQTYGITNDPLTKFALILAALIHDVDHSGVSNDTLVKENHPLAIQYQNQSVAEQNSFDISWNLLMEPSYDNLRRAIYHSEREYKRFRQLLVNSVMATDIMNKDLKERRNHRWEYAFAEDESPYEQIGNDNLKATIVIEHLIMASDVAHTMQHWSIFRHWNEKLFNELCDAYESGRIANDPVEGWYKGEIGFFDFYIIPLAMKLKECGVFGVSSDEFLSYAQQNRAEWELRGEDMVREMVARRERTKNASG